MSYSFEKQVEGSLFIEFIKLSMKYYKWCKKHLFLEFHLIFPSSVEHNFEGKALFMANTKDKSQLLSLIEGILEVPGSNPDL